MLKLAYSGTHGTGKTTAAYAKAAELKREHPDFSVGVLADVERECPLPINGQSTYRAVIDVVAGAFERIAENIRKGATHEASK